MKRLTNTIYGKESKYHVREGERAETIGSEKYHTKWDPDMVASVPPAPPATVREEAPISETKMLPSVVHETILPIEREEIQPVIHREIEKTEIVHVTAPQYEAMNLPTRVSERVLPAEYRPEVRMPSMEAEARLRELSTLHRSSSQVSAVKREVIERPPLIEETLHRRVIEEIQPVIHKEIVEPRVIKEIKPIYERIVEPVRVFERAERYEYQGGWGRREPLGWRETEFRGRAAPVEWREKERFMYGGGQGYRNEAMMGRPMYGGEQYNSEMWRGEGYRGYPGEYKESPFRRFEKNISGEMHYQRGKMERRSYDPYRNPYNESQAFY